MWQVYKSAIQYQFREPATSDSQQMDSHEGQAGGGGGGGAPGEEDISSEAKESGPGLLELSKPSEFRLRALKQQKYLTFNKGRAAFASPLASGQNETWGSPDF